MRDGTKFTGEMIPNITRGADWVLPHCNLFTMWENDVESDILYSLSTTDLQVRYPFQREAPRLEYHPVNKTWIHSVRIQVTDGRNNTLDLI